MRVGSAPTHTMLRTHSSSAASVMAYGSALQPVASPLLMASARREPGTGCTTAASDGPPLPTPTSGLMTLPPCTSWSYCRMIHSLLAMFGCERSAQVVSRSRGPTPRPFPGAGNCEALHAASHTASRVGIGTPSCRKCVSSAPTSVPCQYKRIMPSLVPNSPRSQSSTPCARHTARRRSNLPGGTESTMRSCASEIQISVGLRPSYFTGARSRLTVAPTSLPISPTALENPPAPQSVVPLYSGPSGWSRAASMASSIFFSVIALPICTA